MCPIAQLVKTAALAYWATVTAGRDSQDTSVQTLVILAGQVHSVQRPSAPRTAPVTELARFRAFANAMKASRVPNATTPFPGHASPASKTATCTVFARMADAHAWRVGRDQHARLRSAQPGAQITVVACFLESAPVIKVGRVPLAILNSARHRSV